MRNLKKKGRGKKHVEIQSFRMKKDECPVKDVETGLEEFDTKPFGTSNPVLGTLQSAFVASDELIADLNNAISEGSKQILSFLNKRVYSKKFLIRDTIPKTKDLLVK